MKITCLQCSHVYEVPEGAQVQEARCPACGTPQAAPFPYARTLRIESDTRELARACAREGLRAQALEALEEAFRAGYDDWAAVEGGADFAPLREDPRFAALVARYRKT